MPLQWRVFTGLINSNLMLRSGAQRGVSKHQGDNNTGSHPSRRGLRPLLRVRSFF